MPTLGEKPQAIGRRKRQLRPAGCPPQQKSALGWPLHGSHLGEDRNPYWAERRSSKAGPVGGGRRQVGESRPGCPSSPTPRLKTGQGVWASSSHAFCEPSWARPRQVLSPLGDAQHMNCGARSSHAGGRVTGTMPLPAPAQGAARTGTALLTGTECVWPLSTAPSPSPAHSRVGKASKALPHSSTAARGHSSSPQGAVALDTTCARLPACGCWCSLAMLLWAPTSLGRGSRGVSNGIDLCGNQRSPKRGSVRSLKPHVGWPPAEPPTLLRLDTGPVDAGWSRSPALGL